MISPTAEIKMHNIEAQIYLVARPSEYGLLRVSSTARIRKKMDIVPNIAFVNVI